jgi:hypothetical protein
MKLTKFQTPLAERAVGAAAAAVLLAGVVSAGLVDTEGGPGVPALSAPAATDVLQSSGVGRTGDVVLPPPPPLKGGKRIASLASRGSKGDGVTLDRASSPASVPTPETPVPEGSTSTPSVGVAVGPIAIGASPDGVGGTIVDTPVGDPSAAPDQSGGAIIAVHTGVVPPIVISFP